MHILASIINREGSPTFSDCVFTDNRSLYQVVLYLLSNSTSTHKKSLSVKTNSTMAGLFAFFGSSACDSNSDFTQNEAREGAGIHNQPVSTPDIVSCVF
jgi:hypothetical protein